MRSVIVVCGSQREQTVGVVRAGCRHPSNCGSLHWCAWRGSRPPVVEFDTCGVSARALIAYTDFWAAYAAVLPSNRHPCRR